MMTDSDANPLREFFRNNDGPLIHKWTHYFDVYDRHFARFRGRRPVVLEFGVYQGGSLRMWQDYFGEDARIYGVDIDPQCKELEAPGIEILIGDQADRDFLRSVVERTGPVDVVIEDGGHHYDQQIHTFEEVYPRMAKFGVFLVEDVHTSYWPGYGGGLGTPGTFMEYAKARSDQLNAWHSRQPDFDVDSFTRSTRSMHFYDSIVVFERGPRRRPRNRKTGQAVIRKPEPEQA
jgi:cephalosporin hydroxylase